MSQSRGNVKKNRYGIIIPQTQKNLIIGDKFGSLGVVDLFQRGAIWHLMI